MSENSDSLNASADGEDDDKLARDAFGNYSDVRIEKGLDHTSNVNFKEQQRIANKTKNKFKRRATKAQSGATWLCCRENAKDFKSQKELYDDHIRTNNLKEWN